jgi:hypothetical protein
MKTANFLASIILTLLISVTSCKNDEKDLSAKEMLTAKSWKLQSAKTNGESKIIEDCQKDDILTFLSVGTYKKNPGSNKCSMMDEIESGPWLLLDDEKSLIIDGDWKITIIELTTSKLVILETSGTNNYETTLIAV